MLILISLISFAFSILYAVLFHNTHEDVAIISANIFLASTFVLCGISYFYYKKGKP